MFTSLLPKGAPFFEFLLQQNQILCTVSATLTDIIGMHTPIDKPHQKIAALEEEADIIYFNISKHLSQTFITPIDREDILRISKAQEEAIDLLHTAANRIYIFDFRQTNFSILRVAQTLQEMVKLTGSMLTGLSQKRDSHNTKEFRELKNECEMLLSMGIGELHDLEHPTPDAILNILKWSQTYDRMELATNQVLELAEMIEEAVFKNV